MKQPKKPKYTKTMAAEQLGVSVYKLNKLIAAEALPDKPTKDQVKAFQKENAKAAQTYKAQVIRDVEELTHSIEYCIGRIEQAVKDYRLVLPTGSTPAGFVYSTIYDTRMEEKHGRTK